MEGGLGDRPRWGVAQGENVEDVTQLHEWSVDWPWGVIRGEFDAERGNLQQWFGDKQPEGLDVSFIEDEEELQTASRNHAREGKQGDDEDDEYPAALFSVDTPQTGVAPFREDAPGVEGFEELLPDGVCLPCWKDCRSSEDE